MQRFFHGWITEVEPLLHEVNAQQHLYGKRWPPCTPFRCIGCNQIPQLLQRHDLLHLLQECAVACFFSGKVQTEIKSLHGSGCCRTRHACASTCVGGLCRGSLALVQKPHHFRSPSKLALFLTFKNVAASALHISL